MADLLDNAELGIAAVADFGFNVSTFGAYTALTGGAPLTAALAEKQNAAAQGRPPDYVNAIESTDPLAAYLDKGKVVPSGAGLLAEATYETAQQVGDKIKEALDWTPYVIGAAVIGGALFFGWPFIKGAL